jgi:hypothetical protein
MFRVQGSGFKIKIMAVDQRLVAKKERRLDEDLRFRVQGLIFMVLNPSIPKFPLIFPHS